MADRRLLTDRFLRALPPAPKGQRIEVFDARLPGFGIRVSDIKDAHRANEYVPIAEMERAGTVLDELIHRRCLA